VNKAWERLWGVTLEQVADYNMLEDQQLVERGLMPYIRQAFGGSAVQIPAILYDPNETLPDRSVYADPRRWVRAVAYPLKSGDDKVREVVLIHEDITEQVRAEEERRRVEAERERLLDEAQRAHRELQAASRVKDEFLAMLSHELRTPLNAVLGWARILRMRSKPEDIVRAAEVIERNAAAQARLIDDLLDLSRIITGKIRLTLEPVDLGSVAASALESVRPAAEAKRITISPNIPAELPTITADGQRLQQVFWNLLSNAVKFTDSGGQVTVALGADDGHVYGEVGDTGVGIAPNILPFVFDRFMQGDSSTTRAHSGLGLGLAIVRHLVELHGGTVHAVSDGPGTGATFRFSLPR
jgi:signal transduction histidine kinase